MDLTTLEKLLSGGNVDFLPGRLAISVPGDWIVDNEDRLSYTTIIRLVECCREYHWNLDVEPLFEGVKIDSICKSLSANFIKPIMVGSTIYITWNLLEVRKRGYQLKFTISDNQDNCHAECVLINVFYDPIKQSAVEPKAKIMHLLAQLVS